MMLLKVGTSGKLGTKTAYDWVGPIADFDEGDEENSEMTANEFYLSHIKRGKVIETMIFIFIFSYLENGIFGGVLTDNGTTMGIEKDDTKSLFLEPFLFEKKIQRI